MLRLRPDTLYQPCQHKCVGILDVTNSRIIFTLTEPDFLVTVKKSIQLSLTRQFFYNHQCCRLYQIKLTAQVLTFFIALTL